MNPPRLLPLVAIAIGGVIAVKAIAGAESLPQMFSASSAFAEEASGRKGKAQQTKVPAEAPKPVAVAAPKPAPICAPSLAELAKEANLSPAELTTLQSLQVRRGQLDDRERDIDTQLKLLSAAELKLDAKLRALATLKGEMTAMLGQTEQKTQAEVDRLVSVYEKMRPRDAAAIMATLDDRVRVPVAAKMKERALAAILAQMPTAEAKRLTENLARRFAPKVAEAAPTTAPGALKPTMDPLAQAAPAEPPVRTAKAKPKPKRSIQRKVAVRIPTPAAEPTAAAAEPEPAPKLAESLPDKPVTAPVK